MSDNKQENKLDENFFARVDEHINLANSHFQSKVAPGLVNDSLMFASSRFNAWIAAAGFKSAEEMKEGKDEIINFFVNQYKLMLEDNYNNYAENYEEYMKFSKESAEEK